MRILRWLFILLKVIVYPVLAFAAVVLLVLSTQTGRNGVVKIANPYLQNAHYTIKIKSIRSIFPLNLEIDHIDLHELKFSWANITQLDATIDWLTLWRENTANVILTADSLTFYHLPDFLVESTGSEEHFKLPFHINFSLVAQEIHIENTSGGEDIKLDQPSCQLFYDHAQDQLQSKFTAQWRHAPHPIEVTLDAEGHLNDFALHYKLNSPASQIFGQTFANIEANGQLKGLPWHIDATIDANATLQADPIHLLGHLKQEEGAYVIDNLSLDTKGLAFTTRGEYHQQEDTLKGYAKINLHNPPLLQLTNLPQYKGTLNAETDFSYLAGKLDCHLKMQGQDLQLDVLEAKELAMNVDLTNILNQPDGTVVARLTTASTPLGAISHLQCESKFKQGKADILASFEGPLMNARLAADGQLLDDKKELHLRLLSGRYEEMPFELKQSVQLLYQDQTLTTSPALFHVFNNPITIQGKVNAQDLDVMFKGKIDLLFLTHFFLAGGQVVTGVPEFDFRLHGPLKDPRLQGELTMLDGSIEDPNTGTLFKDIEIILKADEKRLAIEECKATDGEEGQVSIHGHYDLAKKNLDASLTAKKLRLAYTDPLKLVLRDADLTLSGPLTKALLAGSLTLDEVSYDITQLLGDEIETLNVVNLPDDNLPKNQQPELTQSAPPFNLNVDLTLKVPPVVRFYGLGIQSLWKGELKISRSVYDPLIIGSIDLDQGSVDFLGQLVKFNTGQIVFDGQAQSIPLLQAHGEVKKAQTLILVDITGRVTAPKFQFSSDPTMPRGEILSYLLFGKEKSKLSPLEAIKLARALNMYRNPKNSTDFTSVLTNNLGLDQFSLGSIGQDLFGLSFGKRISDNLRVNIDQGLKPEDSKVEAEVDVTDNISLKAEHGLTGSTDAASVNYNWNY